MVSLTLCLVGVKERERYKKETLFWKEMEELSAFFMNELRFTCDEPIKIFSRYLLQTKGKTVPQSHSFSVIFWNYLTDSFGNREKDERIQGFIGGLGVTDLEGQLSHCGRYQRLFCAGYEQAVKEYQVQGVLRQKLWMLSGIAVFLMFM